MISPGTNRFRDRPHDLGRPWVLAHRGASAHAPENTLEAAERGHRAGADGWELDARLTRDGIPVVIHDASLARTTDAARRFANDPRARDGFRVSDFDWAEVRTLDAGSWFLDPSGGPRSALAFGTLDSLTPADRAMFGSGAVRIPSLAEALELTRILDWTVNVELKSFPEMDPRLIDAVAKVVHDSGISNQILVSSFDHPDVPRFRRLVPDAALGVLTTTPLCRPGEYVRDLVGADFYHPSAEALGADSDAYRLRPGPDHLRSADAAEVPTFVYTVNDARPGGLAIHLAAIGVAGLFTDDPAGILGLWRRSWE